MEENKNEDVKVERKSNNVSVIIIVLIAFILAFGCGIILGHELGGSKNDKKDKSKENEVAEKESDIKDSKEEEKESDINDNKEKETEEEPKTKVVLSKEEVNTLLGYFYDVTSGNMKYSVYRSNSVTPQNSNILLLIGNAMYYVEQRKECNERLNAINDLCDYVVYANDIKDEIGKMYGIYDFELPNKINSGGLLHCTLVDDKYACSNSGGSWTTNELTNYFGINIHTYEDFSSYVTEYLKAEKDSKYLYIYENFVNCRFDYISGQDYENIDNYRFRLYKYSDTDSLLVDEYLNGKDFYVENGTYKIFRTKIFDYVGDNFTTYRHTYKINGDDSYTWVKTEPLN